MFNRAKAVIPATVPVVAVFRNDDGTKDRFPVLAWALFDDILPADEELPEEETSSLIGMIIGTGMHSLTPVNDDGFQGEFDGYDYPLGTRAP